MTWPEPNCERHEQFCKTEEWQRVRDARGRTGTHHVTYELTLPDGRILRTRVSHPVDRTGYGASLWAHILRDQLDVVEGVFWACVLEGRLPDRGTPAPPREALPAQLVHLLLNQVGLTEEEVATMDKAQAIERLNQFWTEGR
ncbi:cytotoxic translational repressor of toxin-antitoxin stability system [Kitasatospora sp. NPDC006697]|uniref:cytotoxic translational repressor of toxin-antitoxin stability system n=1 Tax=Kitasatospora sp. NPDC006697 TaxID=3364020 RepID=UPI0036BC6503